MQYRIEKRKWPEFFGETHTSDDVFLQSETRRPDMGIFFCSFRHEGICKTQHGVVYIFQNVMHSKKNKHNESSDYVKTRGFPFIHNDKEKVEIKKIHFKSKWAIVNFVLKTSASRYVDWKLFCIAKFCQVHNINLFYFFKFQCFLIHCLSKFELQNKCNETFIEKLRSHNHFHNNFYENKKMQRLRRLVPWKHRNWSFIIMFSYSLSTNIFLRLNFHAFCFRSLGFPNPQNPNKTIPNLSISWKTDKNWTKKINFKMLTQGKR